MVAKQVRAAYSQAYTKLVAVNTNKWDTSYHGELDYMEREDRVARRRNPGLILPGAQSVIMVGMFYWPGQNGFPKEHEVSITHARNSSNGDETRGVVSSYAWGEDYHRILERKLKTLGKQLNKVAGGVGRFYVDTGAVLERDFAERAGLGFIGKNSLLIHPRGGSGFFIGELFSTVALPVDGDEEMKPGRGRAGCGKCTKCMVACPTGAIVEERVVDARKCISYLTIELKGDIAEELRPLMGNRVYGCDICQQVCPWNRIKWREDDGNAAWSPLFGAIEKEVSTPKLTELVLMDESEFAKRFEKSAVRRIGAERMARNAAVALGNGGAGAADLRALRIAATRHRSALVRRHARWALRRIMRRA